MSWASEILADNPVVWWKYDESSGSFLDNAGGVDHPGSIVGTATRQTASLIAGDPSSYSVTLPGGTAGCIAGPNVTGMFNDPSFSALTVMKLTDLTNDPVVMALDRDGAAQYLRWRLYLSTATGKYSLVYRNASGTVLVINFDGPAAVANTTYYVMLTYTASTFRLYVNGSLHSSPVTIASILEPTGATRLEVGGIANAGVTSGLKGIVDDFVYWQTALSAARVQAIYDAGITPGAPTPPAELPDPTKGSRLYLTRAAAGATPAADSSWNAATAMVRYKLNHIPINDSISTLSASETVATSGWTVAAGQWVSDPIPANFKLQGRFAIGLHGRGPSTSAYPRVVVRVFNGAGTTLRGTAVVATSPYPIDNGGATLYSNAFQVDMTAVDALAGDRIVVDIGFRFDNTHTTGTSALITTGTAFDKPDVAFANKTQGSLTADYRPWVEFSQPNIWGPPKPTVAGESTALAEKPDRTPTRLSGQSVNVLEKPARTPLRLAGMMVNVMVPRANQKPRGIYSVGFPLTEPRILLPNGRWVPFRPVDLSGDVSRLSPTVHSVMDSSFLGGRQVSLGRLPKDDEFVLLTTITKHTTPRRITGLPTGITGMTWTEVYRSLDDRIVIWMGRGGTATGTITIPAYSSETYRISTIRYMKDVKPVLADVKLLRTLGTDTLQWSTTQGRTDQIQCFDALGGSSNPDPVTTFSPGWVVRNSGDNVVATRQNPLYETSPITVSGSYQEGITGALVVVGGSAMSTPDEGPPISKVTRYYPDSSNTEPFAPPAMSSKWDVLDSSIAKGGLTETAQAIAMGNYISTRLTGSSRGSVQLITPPLTAGLIKADFRTVWSVDYIGEAYFRVILRLVSADGAIVRGELADVMSTINADSALNTAATNSLSGSLAQLVAQRGDRIVMEMGFRFAGGLGGGASISQTISANNGDMPFGPSVSHDNTKRPWIEFIPT